MKPKVVHCLFEQSGTFKNEFKRLGYEAYDYDIQNEFGETDYVVDLFSEINGGVNNKPSIFDKIGKDDLIMAFFPCTRFEVQIIMGFKGTMNQMQDWSDLQKLEYDQKLGQELFKLYDLITKLACICLRKGLRMVIENPYSEQHFLHRYWALEPKLIDPDRRKRGDYYAKPTQYWFINCEPEKNFIFEPQIIHEGWSSIEDAHKNASMMGMSRTTVRSMIAPEYANRFIREQILDGEK